METKIINVSIGRTIEATQYDAGQVLVFDGIDIPNGSEAHFSNQKINEKTVINNNQCDIPDNILQIGGKGMLLYQGVEAFKLFMECEMPVEEVKAKYYSDL